MLEVAKVEHSVIYWGHRTLSLRGDTVSIVLLGYSQPTTHTHDLIGRFVLTHSTTLITTTNSDQCLIAVCKCDLLCL